MEKRGKIRYIFSFVTLTVLLGALIFWNINAGSVSVSLGEVFSILFQKGGDETARNIIWSIRLPRILAALILGGALSVSGFLLQTFFNTFCLLPERFILLAMHFLTEFLFCRF